MLTMASEDPSVPGAQTRSPSFQRGRSEWESFLTSKTSIEIPKGRSRQGSRVFSVIPRGAVTRSSTKDSAALSQEPSQENVPVDISVGEATKDTKEQGSSQRSTTDSVGGLGDDVPIFTQPVSEQELVQTLTEHALKIASNILDRPGTGLDLVEDAQAAAEMWIGSRAGSVAGSLAGSRAQSRAPSVQHGSVHSEQGAADDNAVQEFLSNRDDKSSTPSVAEYKEMLKDALTTAVLKASPSPELLTKQAEVSPELIQALATEEISPQDIEVVQGEDGKGIIRMKNTASRASSVKEGSVGPESVRDYESVKEGSVKEGSVRSGATGSLAKGTPRKTPSKVGEFQASIKRNTDIVAPSDWSGSPPGQSIPGRRESAAPLGGLDVVNIGEAERVPGEKREILVRQQQDDDIPLERKGVQSAADQSQVSVKEEAGPAETPADDVQADRDALENLLQEAKQASGVSKSVKSGKSAKSLLSEKSAKSGRTTKSDRSSEKKSTGAVEHTEEFVVGKVKDSKELETIYAPVEEPPKPKEKKPRVPKAAAKKTKGGKGKKGKKEEKTPEPVATPQEPTPQPKEPTPPPPKEPTPLPEDDESDYQSKTPSVAQESEEEMEFIIVRDEFSEEEEEEPLQEEAKSMTSAKSAKSVATTVATGTDDAEDSDASGAKGISNREARAKKRAAQAAKRREDVERKRRERDEQTRREKEAQEQREAMEKEIEAGQKRREEERRLARERAEEERRAEEDAEHAKERRLANEAERERRAKEEYAKKLSEMKKKQEEEDKIRREQEAQRRIEDEERRLQEEELMSKMAEEERLEYQRRRAIEEEERKVREEQERLRREEEARLALEEAKRLAEEMARKQAELEARMQFNRGLQLEANGLDHTQDVTRAFVFSYYELLQWLGLDVPEFENLRHGKY